MSSKESSLVDATGAVCRAGLAASDGRRARAPPAPPSASRPASGGACWPAQRPGARPAPPRIERLVSRPFARVRPRACAPVVAQLVGRDREQPGRGSCARVVARRALRPAGRRRPASGPRPGARPHQAPAQVARRRARRSVSKKARQGRRLAPRQRAVAQHLRREAPARCGAFTGVTSKEVHGSNARGSGKVGACKSAVSRERRAPRSATLHLR